MAVGANRTYLSMETESMSHVSPPSKDYPVAAASPWLLLWVWLPLLAAAGLTLYTSLDRARHTHLDLWITLPFMALLGAVLSWAFARRRIALRDRQLEVVSTFYRKRIGIGALKLDQARVVDLAEHTQFKPSFKTNGFGMPGFKSGHFRMPGGGKAFCLLTDTSRVLVLPLRDGSLVLLSPEQPRQLLQELEQLAAVPARD